MLPVAIAIGCIHSGTMIGKLNGVMPAQTPSGWRKENESTSVETWSEYSPLVSCAMPHANSTTSMPRMTSPLASSKILPCSAGDDPRQLVGVRLDQVAEREHDPRAAADRRLAPRGERGLRGAARPRRRPRARRARPPPGPARSPGPRRSRCESSCRTSPRRRSGAGSSSLLSCSSAPSVLVRFLCDQYAPTVCRVARARTRPRGRLGPIAVVTMRIVPYAPEHRPGVIALFAAELWPSYTRDPMRTCAALRAPGVTSLVALDDDRVVGIVQVQSDGAIQAHLSTLVVARESPAARDRATAARRCAAGRGRRAARPPLDRRRLLRLDDEPPLQRLAADPRRSRPSLSAYISRG